MIEVVPAIIPESLEDVRDHVARVKGLVKCVQVDVVDGIVAPTLTWPYLDRTSFEDLVKGEEGFPFWQEVEYEVHLMVRNPENVIDDWINTGVSSVVFHPSFSENPEAVVEKCRQAEVKVGIAILPSEANQVGEYIKTLAPDVVQVMGNDHIGKHGVKLDENVYETIKAIRNSYDGTIAVDIGVNEKTAPKLIEAGATKLISGSMIFNADDPEEVINSISNL